MSTYKVGDTVKIKDLQKGMEIPRLGQTAKIVAIRTGVLPYQVEFLDGVNRFYADKELELANPQNTQPRRTITSWKQIGNELGLSIGSPPKATCTCLSLDLFHFGCKCGWKDKNV